MSELVVAKQIGYELPAEKLGSATVNSFQCGANRLNENIEYSVCFALLGWDNKSAYTITPASEPLKCRTSADERAIRLTIDRWADGAEKSAGVAVFIQQAKNNYRLAKVLPHQTDFVCTIDHLREHVRLYGYDELSGNNPNSDFGNRNPKGYEFDRFEVSGFQIHEHIPESVQLHGDSGTSIIHSHSDGEVTALTFKCLSKPVASAPAAPLFIYDEGDVFLALRWQSGSNGSLHKVQLSEASPMLFNAHPMIFQQRLSD